jgi:hypothetical protein
MLSYLSRVKEQAKSENDAEDWRAKVDREKERLRNKKPWFGKRLWKAWIALWIATR